MTALVTLVAPSLGIVQGGAAGNFTVAADLTIAVPATLVPSLLLAGYSYPVPSGGGGGSVTPTRLSNTATLTNAQTNVITDTSGSSWPLTMQAAPTDGLVVTILDGSKTWGTNNLQVTPNAGQQIEDPAAVPGTFSSSAVRATVSGGTLVYEYDLAHTRWARIG